MHAVCCQYVQVVKPPPALTDNKQLSLIHCNRFEAVEKDTTRPGIEVLVRLVFKGWTFLKSAAFLIVSSPHSADSSCIISGAGSLHTHITSLRTVCSLSPRSLLSENTTLPAVYSPRCVFLDQRDDPSKRGPGQRRNGDSEERSSRVHWL